MRKLETLSIKNYKSIREQTLRLGALNVFIGGNGVGKSNLISVFRLLREVVTQNLQQYASIKGGANALLHRGVKNSRQLTLKLEFVEGDTSNAYQVRLVPTESDTLAVGNEKAFYHDKRKFGKPFDITVSAGSPESRLRETRHICAEQALDDLESYRVYHFHDTSDTASVKQTGDLDDNEFLRPQAENLAAFLYWMKEKHPDNYLNIVDNIRQIAPFFDDFRLKPSRLNDSKIRLEWREKGNDNYMNAHALSDGTLRFICLATLLLQPELPTIVLLDEPELGLHPAAINLLASLLSSASTQAQVVAATQSVTLINQLTPEDVWTVERHREDGATVFHRLDQHDMTEWVDDYSLGELWERNILGARP